MVDEKKARKKPPVKAAKAEEHKAHEHKAHEEPKAEKEHKPEAKHTEHKHEHKAEAVKHPEKPVEAKPAEHKAPEAVKAEAKAEHKAEHKPAEHKAPEAARPVEHKEAKAPEHKPAEHKAEPKKKKKAPKKEARKVLTARGKRKESVARATIQAGKGVVRMNSLNINSINNHYIREIIAEPLRYVGPEVNAIDISVNVRGGGVMGQAQAARTAIANALARYFDAMNLKEKFISIDRSLMIEDTRRVETKKFRGPKARARFQKSYR